MGALPDHFLLREDGALQYRTEAGAAVVESIADSFNCPSDLTPIELSSRVGDAVKRVFQLGQFTADAFKSGLDISLSEWRQKPNTNYTAWVRLNYAPKRQVVVHLGGTGFRVGTRLPKRLSATWRDPHSQNPELPEDVEGGFIEASGDFRSEDSAGYKLSDKIEELVAFFNFQYSRRFSMVYPESNRALFRTGPAYYLRLESGEYSQAVWINPDFSEQGYHHNVRDMDEHFERAIGNARVLNRRRASNPLQDVALRCISLLNGSWTARTDPEKLLLVWACFEKLFSTGADGSRGGYNTIARRASKFDRFPETREAILLTLANRRNFAAHSVEQTGSCHTARSVVSDANRFLSWLIDWALARGSLFQTKQEFLDWVDIPKDRERLIRRRALHNLAYSYWHASKQDASVDLR